MTLPTRRRPSAGPLRQAQLPRRVGGRSRWRSEREMTDLAVASAWPDGVCLSLSRAGRPVSELEEEPDARV